MKEFFDSISFIINELHVMKVTKILLKFGLNVEFL